MKGARDVYEGAASSLSVFWPFEASQRETSEEHLNICGLNNLVHSVSLVAQALAAVAEEPKVPDQIWECAQFVCVHRVGMSSAAP